MKYFILFLFSLSPTKSTSLTRKYVIPYILLKYEDIMNTYAAYYILSFIAHFITDC